MKQGARIARRVAERAEQRLFDPPALDVDPAPVPAVAPPTGADFSIATIDVVPEVTPVAAKVQRQKNDDQQPAPAPTPAPPPNAPDGGPDQLKAGGTGTTSVLSPSVSFQVYSGKTLQDVSNALPEESGSLTFDIGAATDGDPITRATVTVKQAMVLPRWAERDAQCRPIQAAWDRFASALRQHEDEHVKINRQQLATAHDRYVGRAKSETQDVTTELQTETKAAGDAFDTQTNHGKTGSPSTTIDVGATCEDKKTSAPAESAEKEPPVQMKLEVSEPGDPDEDEADRVAEQVMRMADPREPSPLRLASRARVVQRCAACEAEEERRRQSPQAPAERVRRKCAECEAKEQALQESPDEEDEKGEKRVARKEASGRARVNASSGVVDVTKSGGQPLDAETRAYMEPRFGFDFSRVRIHADSQAADAARSVNAHAYTLGSSVVFGAGRYAPATGEGRRLLAHELTHVVQQQAHVSARVQRVPAPAPASAQPSGPLQMPPDSSNPSHRDLEELEKKAFENAQQQTGQVAAKVYFAKPASADDKQIAEDFKIGSLSKRPLGEPYRIGFDEVPPALAYASIVGLGTGAVVIKQDQFYFVAKVQPGARPLNAYAGTSGQGTNDETVRVKYVNPTTAIFGLTSTDGMQFPFRQTLLTDTDQIGKIGNNPFAPIDPKNPPKEVKDQAATPADAAALRALAGIPNDPKSKGGPSDVRDRNNQPMVPPDSINMDSDQADAFVKSYFRARGLEILAQNEQVANSLAADFKPTTPGQDGAPASGFNPKAKAMMDAAHDAAAKLKDVLEREAQVDQALSFMDTQKAWKGITGEMTYGGKTMRIWDWRDELRKKREEVAKERNSAMQGSPLLAQLVAPERKAPKDLNPMLKLNYWIGGQIVEGFNFLTGQKPMLYGENQVKGSVFGAPRSAQGDETIRADLQKNLDAVRKAIRETRGRMLGDMDFLLGLKGLQLQVRADLDRIQKKYSILGHTMDRLVKDKESKDAAIDTGIAIVQIAALFLPGGQFLSAAIGFGAEVRSMANNMKEWDASKAAADPTQALADQQAVEAKLLENTVMLAVNAADLAQSTIHTFDALEKGGKNLPKDPHPTGVGTADKAAAEAKSVDKSVTTAESHLKSTEEMAFVDEVADVGESSLNHTGRVTQDGLEVCSPTCPIVSTKIEASANKIRAELKTMEGATAAAMEGELVAFKNEASDIDRRARLLARDRENHLRRIREWGANNPGKELPSDMAIDALDIKTRAKGLISERRDIKIRMARLPEMVPIRAALREKVAPDLVKLGLTDESIARIFAKAPNEHHMKGQLLEELLEIEIKKGLPPVPAGGAPPAREFIAGHRIKFGGRQFSDGIIIERRDGVLFITDIFEAKAGPDAVKGLGAAKAPSNVNALRTEEAWIKAIGEPDYLELRREALTSLAEKPNSKLKGQKLEEIWGNHQDEVFDYMRKEMPHSDAGQVRRDIERISPSEGKEFDWLEIDGVPTKVVASPTKTKVSGVTAKGTAVDPGVAKSMTDEGLNFVEKPLSIPQKDIDDLASRMGTVASEAAPKKK